MKTHGFKETAVIVAVLMTLGCGQEWMPQAPPASVAQPALDQGGVQVVNVTVSGVFSPQSFSVRKGKLVRLNFYRDDKPTCATEVVFPSLGIRRALPVGKTTTIEITPDKNGEIGFTCGMDMIKGKLIVTG